MSSVLNNKKLISFFLALVLLIGSVSIVAVGASDSATKHVTNVLEDGIYRIKNISTGKYVDTYDFAYDSLGRAYLDAATGQNGQDFLVQRQSDGSYVFFALTEAEHYALGYSDGISLKKEKEITNSVRFDIFALTNGYYTIALAYKKDSTVLEVSSERSMYAHNFISFGEYDMSDKQQWSFIKVDPTGISLSNTSTRVKPYSIGDLSATVYPTYITDKIEWSSSDESVVMVDSDGSYCALKEGTAVITATCNGVSASCTVNVSGVSAYAWFSQHNIYTGGWNALALKGIYFYAGGIYKPYIMDKYNSNYDWMDEGCLICCIAMLLRNMDATLETVTI